MGLLKLFFVLSLISLPLGQVARLQFENAISIILSDFFVSILFFVWLIVSIRRKKILKQFSKPIPIFIFVASLSLFVNIRFLNQWEFFVSLLYLVRWICYLGLYLSLSLFDNNFKKKIIYLIVFIGAIIIFGGYIQYFFYSSLRNLYYLGWDEHMYRMFSVFLDPNFAGAFFVLYFLFILGLIFRCFEKKENNKIKLLAFVLLLTASLIAVFLTFSRSALITFFSVLFIFLYIKKSIKWIFLAIFLFLIFFALIYKNFNIVNINLFRIVSTEARLKSASDALKIIEKNPVLGVGFNAYRYAQIRYGLKHGIGALESHADAGTDNSFLFVLATTGIIGLVSYLYMWGFLFKNKYSSEFKWLKPVFICSVFGLFINSLFINSLFYPLILMWIWIILGLKESK